MAFCPRKKREVTAKRFRVGIVNLNHESNTFIPEATTLGHFQQSCLLQGEEILEKYSDAHHEVSGFIQTLREEGVEPVPILFAHAMPWGVVEDAAIETLWEMTRNGLEAAGPLDGLLVANHGAGVGQSYPDLDGWWLGKLREFLGPEKALIATIDPHANLSVAMVAACDALVAYRENPHLDQRQRGEEAARLMVRTLRGEIFPVTAASYPPVAINIERQLSFDEPMLTVKRQLDRTRGMSGVLSASVTMGFPYADVEEMGAAFLVVTDRAKIVAQSLADDLAGWCLENRSLFRGKMISPDDAITRAVQARSPVGLLDMGDNMGGGAPGDSTILAQLCLEHPEKSVFWYLPDPAAAAEAIAAGVGSKLTLKIGGKLPLSPGPSLELSVDVVSIHDGKFQETKPRHGGRVGGDMGPTAIVRTESGLTIMLMSRRNGPIGSVQPIYSCGLDPKDFDILLIKGVHAPVGGYGEVCATLIRVDTPGVTRADMAALPYVRRRKPLFPFEDTALPASRIA